MNVFSETGPLKRVLLHRPGKELEHLVPDELERLLFDDIPYLKAAQSEHDAFAAVLRSQGAEVVYLETLMAETLRAKPWLKEMFVHQFILEGGSKAQAFEKELSKYLLQIPSEEALVQKTMSGVSSEELGVRDRTGNPQFGAFPRQGRPAMHEYAAYSGISITDQGDRALAEKFEAEVRRIAAEKSAANNNEAVVQAAKTLGFEVTLADLEKMEAALWDRCPKRHTGRRGPNVRGRTPAGTGLRKRAFHRALS